MSKQIERADRNALLYLSQDSYDPKSKGINGRRVAGQSFLKGFLKNADVDEFLGLTNSAETRKLFSAHCKDIAPQTPIRFIQHRNVANMKPAGVLYYPSPNTAASCWARQKFGADKYSVCGITHTLSTKSIMKGTWELRAGPQTEWDAIICTSTAAQAAFVRNLEIAEEFLVKRFGSLPPRPKLPVIPLGIECTNYEHNAKARKNLRTRMGWGDKDIVVVTLARLLPHEKFDPGPLYLALQQAQEKLGKKKRLHFIACGIYGNESNQRIFETAAAKLMPDVSFHHLDGADARARQEALSGGDIFTFPIDNVQESFGLAPIEAMAAGLPVVASDWDGIRDTVSSDVGILSPTCSVSADATGPEGHEFASDAISYAAYGNRLAMITQIDVPKLANAFHTLAGNASLRKKMGEAGKKRAKSVYDWSVVIPQYQELWEELGHIRKSHREPSYSKYFPMMPKPMDMFASFPTKIISQTDDVVIAKAGIARFEEIYTARLYDKTTQLNLAETKETFLRVFNALIETGETGATPRALSRSLKVNVLTIERCVLFFLKYDLAFMENA